MVTAYVLKGHVNPDGTVVCDEHAPLPPGPVEVTIKPLPAAKRTGSRSIVALLDSLPPGTRTKEDIDRQVKEERDTWERS